MKTLNLLHREFVSLFNVLYAYSSFHSFLDVFKLLLDSTFLGYPHLLAYIVVSFIVHGGTFRAVFFSRLQGSSLVAEVKYIIINPWLMLLPLTINYLPCCFEEFLIEAVGEVVYVPVEEVKCSKSASEKCHSLLDPLVFQGRNTLIRSLEFPLQFDLHYQQHQVMVNVRSRIGSSLRST